MGFDLVSRHQFCLAVTDLFSPEKIAETAKTVATHAPTGDHLDIFHRLNVLPSVPDGKLDAYRSKLGIPALHQQIVTQTLRSALASTPPHPVVFHVTEGPAEGVDVKSSGGKIYVTVTRTSFAPSAR